MIDWTSDDHQCAQQPSNVGGTLTCIEMPVAILPHILLTSGPFFFSRFIFLWMIAWNRAIVDKSYCEQITRHCTGERSNMSTGPFGFSNGCGVEDGSHVGEMMEANFQGSARNTI